MVRNVLHFMDNHSISKPVIVGHGMGGKVAQTIRIWLLYIGNIIILRTMEDNKDNSTILITTIIELRGGK